MIDFDVDSVQNVYASYYTQEASPAKSKIDALAETLSVEVDAPKGSSSNALMRKVQFEYQMASIRAIDNATQLDAPKRASQHYVGELQEKWQFRSDHLPVGVTIDNFHVATWNVLNDNYMDWLLKNSQGLLRSQIVEEHQYIADTELTVRDKHVVAEVVSMINHPTHPRSVLALQECSPAFLAELHANLPDNMQIVFSAHADTIDQDILIYNTDLFELRIEESSIVRDGYPCAPGKGIMDIVLQKKDTGVRYQFINSHVPGDPRQPGRYEFANWVMQNKMKGAVTVTLGDMNFNIQEMEAAFRKAAKDLGVENPFDNFASYNTNVGPDFFAKSIDHIQVDREMHSKVSINKPEEVLNGLQKIVDLLEETAPRLIS